MTFLATYKLHEKGEALGCLDGARIPEELRSFLQQVNTNSYANGFFRFLPGRDYGLDPSECFVFLQCAFGQLIFHHKGEYKAFNPVFNCVDTLGDGLEFVMDIVPCDRPAMESSFLIDVYEQAFPRLGAPARDEIYTFVPALGLGGARNADNVRRSKSNVEMAILTQV
jgi:hypothetical protein